VKATLVRYGRTVEIHGQEQLNPPPNGSLYLGVLQLEAVGSGGRSVPEIVTSILDLGVDREDFFRRLDRIGYRVDDQDAYSAMRFKVREGRIYAVGADFPRIVPESFLGARVPPGVTRLVYQIDLTGEPPNPLGESEVRQVLERLGTDG
jgi:hypothetical protein